MVEQKKVIILADGVFPWHPVPLKHLNSGLPVVCCDGAGEKLVDYGIMPLKVVGDLDSLSSAFMKEHQGLLHVDVNQEDNDLTKTVRWCVQNGFSEITILGATGHREDHALGNISLLLKYSKMTEVKMVTDHGVFYTIRETTTFPCVKGQQVSFFSMNNQTRVTTSGLKYPLENSKLEEWWQGSLNETTGSEFTLHFDQGHLIVFICHTGIAES